MLVWLVKRFEPTADLPTDVESEQDRVILIRWVGRAGKEYTYIMIHGLTNFHIFCSQIYLRQIFPYKYFWYASVTFMTQMP